MGRPMSRATIFGCFIIAAATVSIASMAAAVQHQTPRSQLKRRQPAVPLAPIASLLPTFDWEQEEYLNAHNELRRRVGVPPLVWSAVLAAEAHAWAMLRRKDCNYRHHSSGQYGENIFWMNYKEFSPRDVVQWWFNEYKLYDGVRHRCRCRPERAGCECGHYLSVVWSTTRLVGCSGATYCDNQKGVYVVCAYDPAGLIPESFKKNQVESSAMENLGFYLSPFIILAIYTTILHLLNKLRNHPPSPFPALPFIGHIYLLKKPFHRSLSQVSRRHGPALFLQLGSRPVLLISSPSLAEECLTNKNDVIFANRPDLLNGRYFGYNYTSLSWSSYGEHWRNLRRISSLELLSMQRIQMLSHVRADETLNLVHKLFHLTREEPDKALEVKSALFEFSFNVLTRMITGKRYYGKNVENSKEAKMLEEITLETSKVAFETNVVDYLPFMKWFGFKDVEKKLFSIHEKRDRFMQNVIEDNRRFMMGNHGAFDGDQVKKKTMVEVLLDLQRSDPQYYTDETIKNLLLVLLQGGSSTSTIALEWAFSLLLDSPDILKKAQSEIDAHVGYNRIITESDVAELPYLRHIILETLRLHPPVSILMPHVSSADCAVAGYRVPAGTVLLVNVWEIHHSPEIWADPEKFRPERFEGFEGKKDLGFRFFPFGLGRRACPGENLGLLNIALCLGSLIQCFDWEKDGEIDMSEGAGTTTPKVQPLMAKCSPRPFVVNFLS